MAPKIQKARRRKATKSRRNPLPEKDMLSAWAILSPNYGGGDQPGINNLAHECPFGLMNLLTTVTGPNWEDVKQYRFRAITVRFTLPESDVLTDGHDPIEMFLGWNKTPADMQQHTMLTYGGYMEMRARADTKVISGRARTLELRLPDTPWKTYMDVKTYLANEALLKRDIGRFTNGSLIFGFLGMNASIKAGDFKRMLRVECVQEVRYARNIQ